MDKGVVVFGANGMDSRHIATTGSICKESNAALLIRLKRAMEVNVNARGASVRAIGSGRVFNDGGAATTNAMKCVLLTH
jgi:hypothetical protein